MTRIISTVTAFIAAAAVGAHAADKPTPPTSGGSVTCKAGDTYNPRICGSSPDTIPSYCLDEGKVMRGYIIMNGKCRQDNGGGE